jgi:hypothetical protein
MPESIPEARFWPRHDEGHVAGIWFHEHELNENLPNSPIFLKESYFPL